MKYCSQCWAIRLCSLCYADRYTEDGYNKKFNLSGVCDAIRNSAEEDLILYNEFLENDNCDLDFIKDLDYR